MYMLYDSTYSKISRKYTLIYNDKKQFWLPGDGIGEQKRRLQREFENKVHSLNGSGGLTGIHVGLCILIPNCTH